MGACITNVSSWTVLVVLSSVIVTTLFLNKVPEIHGLQPVDEWFPRRAAVVRLARKAARRAEARRGGAAGEG